MTRNHLPNDHLNKRVDPKDSGGTKVEKDLSRAQGVTTKQDAKAARESSDNRKKG